MKKGNILIIAGLLLMAAALSLSIYNIREAKRAGDTAAKILVTLEDAIEIKRKEESDSDIRSSDTLMNGIDADMEMPVETVDGREYIGVLEIAALDLELPVLSEWSYEGLRCAPCRYSGSVYSRDMILAGHNYTSHFGSLKNLAVGEEIIFRDMTGSEFVYEVTSIEELPGTAVEAIEAGEWDMTLFTCTLGGRSRVVLRCTLAL